MVKLDMHILAHHLKQERLYVNSEKQLIQRLNAEHAKVLEDTQFVDGYKQLGFQETAYGEFLNRLRENPRLIASCLVAGEKLNQENIQNVIHTVFTSIYGNCIMPEDENFLLQVLRYLVEFELKESDNPRRLLRRGTCAFSVLFKLFSEGLFSAKLFLTATLHEPIMQLLVEDEDHLETDPHKLTERFSPAQQEKFFGEKGSEKFRQKVQEMVDSNEAKLVALVNKFIGYLKQNTYCFPHSLRWIMSQMYKTLSCVERLEVGEVRAMCTDLLLACFICPAVVNPEQYGIISDAPINEVARFNLMQVGRLLQQLAMFGSEDGDPRTKASLGKFDKGCVASFLDVVIGGRAVETPPMSSVNLLEGLSRTVVYMTYSQLTTLVLNMQLSDGGPGDVPVDDSKLHGKPDKTLRFSLCSDNLEGISEGPSNRSNSVSSLDLEGESVSESGAGPSGSNGVEALQLLEREQDRDISETVSETWSTDVLGSDFDPNMDEDRLQEITGAAAENVLGSLLCLPGSGSVLFDPCTGSTISETTSEAWSIEVLPSDSGEGSPIGASHLTSPPCQADTLLAMFDPLVSHEGNAGSPRVLLLRLSSLFPEASGHILAPTAFSPAVVRPKVHYARPSHPPPDPPILEGTLGGSDARLPSFASHTAMLFDSEAFKQRYSYPERLVRSRSSDIVSSARRPMSDPGWNRRAGTEERDLLGPGSNAGGVPMVPGPQSSSSSPSKDFCRGEIEDRKDSDDEKSDRNRPWWRKRFVSAMPKGKAFTFFFNTPIPFRKKEKQDKEKDDFIPDRFPSLQDDPGPRLSSQAQAAEDILDKYRNAIKRASPSEGAVVNYDSAEAIGDSESIHDALQNMSADDLPDSASQAAQPQDSTFSYSTLEGMKTDKRDNEIVCFLKVQLAEAINLQDKNLMAQLQETMRCVGRFDNRTCRKLLASIAEDYRKRAPYFTYLTRCRQGLQTTQAHLERLLQRVLRDKEVANHYFTTVCVRLLLESKESKIREFIQGEGIPSGAGLAARDGNPRGPNEKGMD
ncbi:hypothetical protein Chor_002056 [Crotalus horridus]